MQVLAQLDDQVAVFIHFGPNILAAVLDFVAFTVFCLPFAFDSHGLTERLLHVTRVAGKGQFFHLSGSRINERFYVVHGGQVLHLYGTERVRILGIAYPQVQVMVLVHVIRIRQVVSGAQQPQILGGR